MNIDINVMIILIIWLLMMVNWTLIIFLRLRGNGKDLGRPDYHVGFGPAQPLFDMYIKWGEWHLTNLISLIKYLSISSLNIHVLSNSWSGLNLMWWFCPHLSFFPWKINCFTPKYGLIQQISLEFQLKAYK